MAEESDCRLSRELVGWSAGYLAGVFCAPLLERNEQRDAFVRYFCETTLMFKKSTRRRGREEGGGRWGRLRSERRIEKPRSSCRSRHNDASVKTENEWSSFPRSYFIGAYNNLRPREKRYFRVACVSALSLFKPAIGDLDSAARDRRTKLVTKSRAILMHPTWRLFKDTSPSSPTRLRVHFSLSISQTRRLVCRRVPRTLREFFPMHQPVMESRYVTRRLILQNK